MTASSGSTYLGNDIDRSAGTLARRFVHSVPVVAHIWAEDQ